MTAVTSTRILPWWGMITIGLLGVALLVLLVFAVVGLSSSEYKI